jgi:hypothetical protein
MSLSVGSTHQILPDLIGSISEQDNIRVRPLHALLRVSYNQNNQEMRVLKTFIVYSLDTRLPIAVGEAIKAEWARIETADKTKIPTENLIAEEIAVQNSDFFQDPHASSLKRVGNKSRGNR